MGRFSMNRYIVIGILISALTLHVTSCSNRKVDSNPVLPDEVSVAGEEYTGNSHSLLGYWLFSVNEDHTQVEVISERSVNMHLNVRGWLENGPCTDCIKIYDVEPKDGYTKFRIQIYHPFYNTDLYGFDVRGICMFNGSKTWTTPGLISSDSDLGDGELLNADGYTRLYNPTTAGHGVFGYSKGKFATPTLPNATLNGFKWHEMDIHHRNVFDSNFSWSWYDIKFPQGAFVFGYAVDASWAPPLVTPVTDPETQFPIIANCTEPWRIDVENGVGLTSDGGNAKLEIRVWDWQGMDTHGTPRIECPELFDGYVEPEFMDYNPNGPVSDWVGFISNEKGADWGYYDILISCEANENAASPEHLDLTCYKMFEVFVAPSWASGSEDVTPGWLSISGWDTKVDDNYCYVASGPNGLHIFDISNPVNPVWVNVVTMPDLELYDEIRSFELIDGIAYCAWDSHGLVMVDVDPPETAHVVKQVELDKRADQISVSGGHAFIRGEQKLRIVDVDPIESAYMLPGNDDLGSHLGSSIMAHNGYVYLGLASYGIDIYDVDPPESASLVHHIDVDEYAFNFTIKNNYLLVAAGLDGMYVIDITNPETASIVDTVGGDAGYFLSIMVDGNTACLAGIDYPSSDPPKEASLTFFDITDPLSITQLGQIAPKSTVSHLDLQNGYCYAFDIAYGLQVIDYEPMGSIDYTGDFNSITYSNFVTSDGDYLYVLGGSAAPMKVLDFTIPDNPTIVGEWQPSWEFNMDSMTIWDNYAFICGYSNQIAVLDITNPANPVFITDFATVDRPRHTAVKDGHLLIAEGEGGGGAIEVANIDPIADSHIVHTINAIGEHTHVEVHDDIGIFAENSMCLWMDIDPPEETHTYMPITAWPAIGQFGLESIWADNDIAYTLTFSAMWAGTPDVSVTYDVVDVPSIAYDMSVE